MFGRHEPGELRAMRKSESEHARARTTFSSRRVDELPRDKLFTSRIDCGPDRAATIQLAYEFSPGAYVFSYVSEAMWDAWTQEIRDSSWRKLVGSVA